MRCPSIAEDEEARLEALAQYGLDADTGLPSLDPIVDMAAKMFNCPVAAVNLIGHDHVFLVSRQGIEDYEPGRDVSFCAHAINQDGVMVVPDAALDPRFHDNPMVTHGATRFYAGVPLRSPSGHALGALCIIDSQPHPDLAPPDRARLVELGKLAADRLELRRIEYASEAGHKRLQASAETSPNAVLSFDSTARITAWNGAAAAMFGLTRKEALGSSLDRLVVESDRPKMHAGIARVLEGGSPGTEGTELCGVTVTGEVFPAELHWSRWHEGDQMHFGAIIRDMTARRREHDALYKLANFDTLTGLPNRNYLNRKMEEALADGQPFTLILTDLGGFRDINNTLGNAAGDRLLDTVAARIGKAVPQGSVVCRIGGDEFATMLGGESGLVAAASVARAINLSLAEPVAIDGHEVRIVGNCGMALAPEHGETVEEVMASANLALFQARSVGRGGAFLYHPSLKAEAVARRMHEAELHRAFERGEFDLFYQPQRRLADGALCGAEALIRWHHPQRGLLAPLVFLPALEAGDLAEPVGRWILDNAFAQATEWRQVQPDFRMNVNLFSAQFREGNLPATVLELLRAHDLTPDAIELEITENIILDGEERVLEQLRELRAAGVSLAFDDFGTGYASLNLLRNFPVTQIKIDKSFIQALRNSDKDKAIVLSLIDLAHKLDLSVVAEGVESQSDAEFLLAHGCETGQGYLFGRPVPAVLFEEQHFLAQQAALSA